MDDPERARAPDAAPDARPPPVTARIAAAPLHHLVRRQISAHIVAGDWPPGTVLPAEVDLARVLGVSVGTLRRALAELVREGLLSRRRKTGTVVTGRTPHHTLSQFFQFFRLHRRDGSRLHSTTLTRAVVQRPADDVEIADLGLAPQARVFDIARTRAIDGRAIMHEHLVLPAAFLPGFPPPEVPDLLYRHLLERYGIRIAAVRENIRAEALGDEDRRLLDVETATAVLIIEELAYDQAGRAVLRGRHRAVTDAFMYVNEVN